MKLGIILTPSVRSKAYIQKIIQNKFSLCEIILLNDKKIELTFENEEILESKKSGFDISKSIITTLEENNLTFTEFNFIDINHQKLTDFISKSDSDVFIFTGGGILRDQILKTGKKFIHFHPGIVPKYRGSTCFYYSIINENQCGVTAYFMDKNIDTGKIILQKFFEPPNHEFIDNVYDSFIRSETLLEVLKNNLLESKNFKDQLIDGDTYFIIHPVLKHLAILSCVND